MTGTDDHLPKEQIISSVRVRSALLYIAIAVGFVLATAVLRGQQISEWNYLNPDEAELLVQARAARHSPVPFSTWITGTTGPYWTLFLTGLAVFGAPLTLTFAHFLAAALLGLTAAALLVAASRVIGFGPAWVVTALWWFPFAVIFPVGDPLDFGALATEYLPTLLVVTSALVRREQLAARPWLFAVVGALAGVAVGSKFQVAPLAVAFAAAQMMVLHTHTKRTVVSMVWWAAGAVLPLAAIVLTIVVSPATNWVLVDQTLSFLGSYAGGPTAMQKLLHTWDTFTWPAGYMLVLLAVVIWLGRHSDRRSKLARIVVIGGGLVCTLIGGMGFPHYLILLFGALGLATTMPIKPGAQLVPQRLSPALVASAVAVVTVVMLVVGYAMDRWRPLSPQQAAAAFSANSVHRNSSMARACPPGSSALVWGWAPEIFVEQDWQNTVPYPNVLGMAINPAIRDSAEPIMRAGIDQASCVVDATNVKRPQCPPLRSEHPLGYCLPPTVTLARIYPQLSELVRQQFHTVPIIDGCDGCTFYVRSAFEASS
ncbi:hypothetical protein DSM43518_05048 [Mycobacterium marinum]|uniref:Uncharacterized protein n=1 Tax=Mycobacterium marinum TaxID=1781 RepID=A0A2Z5YE56_MYCMR|nr:hypothetical protein [Mycobacterium marinum]AXN44274.1 hypothetical protein MM1218R_02336 [Mycobacterium marinum]AXN49644.1 hypothetical protein CCUG20998_02237 [Mycobacterium marinum]RFZ02231.1 hypothetical protein DSM43518_05048 [Mycobacterium marinum]RFZ03065.1 hypothetical protein DE4381_04467 [Mycobacterium marinum]RFZ12197.1 hypothetical protein VIMS_03232 [Mycobacterium marinum]